MKTIVTLLAALFCLPAVSSAQITWDNVIAPRPTYVRPAPAAYRYASPASNALHVQRATYNAGKRQPMAWTSVRTQTPVQHVAYKQADIAPSLLSPPTPTGNTYYQSTATPPRSKMQPINGPGCVPPAYINASPAPYPQLVAVPTVTYRPVMALRPMPGSYEIGRGLLGQPKLYVPNQPVRNFLRYVSP